MKVIKPKGKYCGFNLTISRIGTIFIDHSCEYYFGGYCQVYKSQCQNVGDINGWGKCEKCLNDELILIVEEE